MRDGEDHTQGTGSIHKNTATHCNTLQHSTLQYTATHRYFEYGAGKRIDAGHREDKQKHCNTLRHTAT